MSTKLAYARTTIPASDGPLPESFRLFLPGPNENYNADKQGEVQPIFTPRSAAKIKAAAARKGSDYFLDLEHSALNNRGPGATDAMAWFRVEVRPDGSCWAVNVRWTPEGARRLRARSQRYISPVFYFDRDSGEVTELVGVALTSDPATYGALPLMAASRAASRKPILSAVLSTKVPEATRYAFGLLAVSAKMTPSELLRRLIERAHWLGSGRIAALTRTPADLDTLLELLDLDSSASTAEIVAAVEMFLESLAAGTPGSAAPDVPIDPTAGTADPPARDPVAAARLASRVASMSAAERDRFTRIRASMAADRAAQRRRPPGTGARPPFSPAVRAKLATMTRAERAKFDSMIASWRK